MNPHEKSDFVSADHQRSVFWIVVIATLALFFDGYDLVVYGTILPILMGDPDQIGQVSAQQAGALGAYALVGVMIGALVSGALGDHLGRRKLMLVNIAWFSVGMGMAAMATSIETFGLWRLFTGIGIGGLIVTVATLIADFAPPGKKNLYNAVVYGGFPVGGVFAALLAMVLREEIGWRGMFWIGALPIVVLLPLAYFRLPESPRWLVARGRLDEARAVTAKSGVPAPALAELEAERAATPQVGFSALITRQYFLSTLILGVMSFGGLLLTYGLNTWLPKIMETLGYDSRNSLAFLLMLNGGAVVGGVIASRVADRIGAQKVIATTFALAAVSLVLLTFALPLPVLLFAVAVAGVGTIGTQVLIYGFVANYFSTTTRSAGMAWCAGFGRLGGIFGPLIGGIILGAGLGNVTAFYIFAGVALLGGLLTLSVPRKQA
ncbi:aromatic acid/H+ symport family MFS transporter [Neomegalonema sp.]|uniref:MFS transporter n=1 Tax=Neomegalonema sp. TaxID=2039713 RepID=UPI0026108E3C|nr:aromatic acid/H+ symport family MFS transporter [Neomegalonema sp.]MDD2867736.1 aromatic acid/H+ symport family MFS transporter [Neomegalonema sp.]